MLIMKIKHDSQYSYETVVTFVDTNLYSRLDMSIVTCAVAHETRHIKYKLAAFLLCHARRRGWGGGAARDVLPRGGILGVLLTTSLTL